METMGTILIAVSLLTSLAAFAERFGPALQEQGIPLYSSITPLPLWIALAVILFVAGVVPRRRATPVAGVA